MWMEIQCGVVARAEGEILTGMGKGPEHLTHEEKEGNLGRRAPSREDSRPGMGDGRGGRTKTKRENNKL